MPPPAVQGNHKSSQRCLSLRQGSEGWDTQGGSGSVLTGPTMASPALRTGQPLHPTHNDHPFPRAQPTQLLNNGSWGWVWLSLHCLWGS